MFPTVFKWETLREVEPDTRRLQSTQVAGKACEVELTSGRVVRVWCSDDGRQYFCHGLTFGGKESPGGIISPYGNEVPTILSEYYNPVPEAEAQPGDILIWRGLDANEVIHSAILTQPVVMEGSRYRDLSSRLQSKNGIISPEASLTLDELINAYGESYNVFRRK